MSFQDGKVVGYTPTKGLSMDEISPILKRISDNHAIEMVFTDRCCQVNQNSSR